MFIWIVWMFGFFAAMALLAVIAGVMIYALASVTVEVEQCK